METTDFALHAAECTMYALIALLALVYSLPIMCIRRFQHQNNIFTLNVCLTTVCSCLLWLPTSISPLFGYSRSTVRRQLPWLYFLQILSDMAVPFSLVLVSFHRCCSIVYPHKRFFRTKTWIVMCFVGQWVIATVLSIPDIVHPRWVGIYIHCDSRSEYFNLSLEIKCTVATGVSAREYGDRSSDHLYHHEHSDILACSLFV